MNSLQLTALSSRALWRPTAKPVAMATPSLNHPVMSTLLYLPCPTIPPPSFSYPDWLNRKRTSLKDNEGCFKCHHFSLLIIPKSAPMSSPDPGNYKTLMLRDVDIAKRAQKGKAVAAVATVDDDSDDELGPSSANPVAVVLRQSVNPVTYIPSNDSNVIGDRSDSNSDVSAPLIALTKLPMANTPNRGMTALFHIPHLYWQCITDGKVNSFPIHINALLDHGSHGVFISEQLADSLGLRCRQLPKPETVEMAMNTGTGKSELVLRDWVKLKFRDPSSFWSSKSVRAIIAPGLCAPVILGLPFLSHNNIVIDHSSRTAIDKSSGFDLLNPVALPPPPPPKKRLKDFYNELWDNWKLLVAKLKMVCAERLCMNMHTRTNWWKWVTPWAAIKIRIKTLAAQEKLTQLGAKIKDEYADVFNPIPHLDHLPTDVYCCMQLKDASKTIHTWSYSTPRKYQEAWSNNI